MKVLRLTSSDDFLPSIPENERAYVYAEQVFTAETGIPVETTLKRFWPAPGFDEALERWLDEVEPEMVFFIVPSYPVCYESVPLRLERRLKRVGRLLNSGSQAAASSRIGSTTLFHAGRRLATRTIGGDTIVTVPEMMAYVERATRKILAREGTVLAIRGPKTPFGVETPAARARSEGRRQHLNRELRALCDRHHVALQLFDEPPHPAEDRRYVMADRVHMGPGERKKGGEFEGHGMVAAWNEAHAQDYLSSDRINSQIS